MTGKPLVSVVIPTLNAGSSFDRCLDAVSQQRAPGRVELIVIDSGSRDGTVDRARAVGARVLEIARRHFNHGFARNQAIAAAAAEYVVLTVQDALPADNEWLIRLLEPLLNDSEIAGSYGLQVAPPSAGLLARTRSSQWCQVHGEPRLQSLRDAKEWDSLAPEERWIRSRFDNVTSCVRRGVWKAIPFPRSSFGEDMAWAGAALRSGYTLAYIPSAKVWHSHERGWKYELRRSYADGTNRVRLMGWPSAELEIRDVLAIARRVAFFARTRRFDHMREPEEALLFLRAEKRYYEPLSTLLPLRVYLTTLGFATELTEGAIGLLNGGIFGQREWVELFRFALAATVGRELGTTAATELAPSGAQRAFWQGLDRLLLRGI